jgi:hypothetical protein
MISQKQQNYNLIGTKKEFGSFFGNNFTAVNGGQIRFGQFNRAFGKTTASRFSRLIPAFALVVPHVARVKLVLSSFGHTQQLPGDML